MKFCSNCGTSLKASMAFCTGCGVKVSKPRTRHLKTTTVQSIEINSHNNKRKYIIVAVVAAVVIIAILYFTMDIGGHEIHGRWVSEHSGDYPVTITFTRNRFTSVNYSGSVLSLGFIFDSGIPEPYWIMRSAFEGCSSFVAVSHFTFVRRQAQQDGVFIPGNWERGIWRITRRGRWYITDDILELVFDCGDIAQIRFVQTANTLTIGGMRFLR